MSCLQAVGKTPPSRANAKTKLEWLDILKDTGPGEILTHPFAWHPHLIDKHKEFSKHIARIKARDSGIHHSFRIISGSIYLQWNIDITPPSSPPSSSFPISGVFCALAPNALMKWYAAQCMEWSMHLNAMSIAKYKIIKYEDLQNTNLFWLKSSPLRIEFMAHGSYSNVVCTDAIADHPP